MPKVPSKKSAPVKEEAVSAVPVVAPVADVAVAVEKVKTSRKLAKLSTQVTPVAAPAAAQAAAQVPTPAPTLPVPPVAPSQVKKSTKALLKKKTQAKKNKKPKTKRVHNVKPTNLNTTGIGIGPARVKAVLINVSLNPSEFKARNAILAAENKPKMPKPVKDSNGVLQPVEMPAQGKQTPVSKLDAETVAKIKEAEDAHDQSLRSSYERFVVESYSEERKKLYTKKRKEYKDSNGQFNAAEFNKSFDKHFYSGFGKYVEEHDSYVVGKEFPNVKNGKHREPYNEWTRAAALVNKLTVRLSGNTRNIIACFIDRLVEQLAYNALFNSILEKRRILQLHHAVYVTSGYSSRVPLSSFIETLHNYKKIVQWLTECQSVKEQNKVLKANEEEQLPRPAYPIDEYLYDFSGYVGEVCRTVRIACAESSPEAEKERYLGANVSYEFKRFCSDLINETIARIGASLKHTVEREGVKTISDSMVYYTMEQLHSMCGCDYQSTRTSMTKHMETFIEWKAKRKLDRVNKKTASAAADAAADEEESDSDEDADDAEEVEVEVDANEADE